MPDKTLRKEKRIYPNGVPAPAVTTYPRPLFLIAQLHDEMLRRLDKHMEGMGMTWGLGRVFNAIATRPHISSAQLAKMFGIAPQSVKQSVMALEKRGLVERVPSKSDQRVLETILTEKGQEVRRSLSSAFPRMYEEVFGEIDEDDVNDLIRILINIIDKVRPEALDYFTDLNVREPLGRPKVKDSD